MPVAYQPFVPYQPARVIEKYENGQLIERIVEGMPPTGNYGGQSELRTTAQG